MMAVIRRHKPSFGMLAVCALAVLFAVALSVTHQPKPTPIHASTVGGDLTAGQLASGNYAKATPATPQKSEAEQVLDNLDAACGVGWRSSMDLPTTVNVKEGDQLEIVCKVQSRNPRPIKDVRFYIQGGDDVISIRLDSVAGSLAPSMLKVVSTQSLSSSDKEKLRALKQLFGEGVPMLSGLRSTTIVPYQVPSDQGTWMGVVPINANERFDELLNSVNISRNIYAYGAGQTRTISGWLSYEGATRKVNDVTISVGYKY